MIDYRKLVFEMKSFPFVRDIFTYHETGMKHRLLIIRFNEYPSLEIKLIKRMTVEKIIKIYNVHMLEMAKFKLEYAKADVFYWEGQIMRFEGVVDG